MRSLWKCVVAGLLIAPLLMGGCANGTEPASERDIGFSISASNEELVVGEMVTLTAHTENTLGRDAKVKWTSTGGDIRTEESGRIARVTFDKPGAYTVTARLTIDGRVVREDSQDVRVKPVP